MTIFTVCWFTDTEFRLTIDPSGSIKSPTVNCTPDLSRTPLRSIKRRNIVLRAPSTELKAVWQNLLTRQIFIVNSTLGSSLNSPLESPDIMISQLGDMNLLAHRSIASIKMCSIESINNQRNQQVSFLYLCSFSLSILLRWTYALEIKIWRCSFSARSSNVENNLIKNFCHCRVKWKPTAIIIRAITTAMKRKLKPRQK